MKRIRILRPIGSRRETSAIRRARQRRSPAAGRCGRFARWVAVASLVVSLTAGRVAACTGDCNLDDRVALGELLLCVGMSLENRSLDACPQCSPGENVHITDLVAAVVNSLRGCPGARPPAACGNGLVESGESCDDGGICVGEGGAECSPGSCSGSQECIEGACVQRCESTAACARGVCRPMGGDGCAANCTREDVRVGRLDPLRSPYRIQTASTTIDLSLAATWTFRTGRLRDDRVLDPQGVIVAAPGDIPVSSRSTDVAFDLLPIAGLACACVRQVPSPATFGPGLSGVGTIGCGEPGLMNVSYRTARDHNTEPGDPNNGSQTAGLPQLDDDPECDDEFVFDGYVSRACREGEGEGCDDPTAYIHRDLCNSPLTIALHGGVAPRGSAFIHSRIAVGLLADNGACTTERPMQNGSCRYRDYGPDCLPCTDDDLHSGLPESLLLTTGTAQAAIYDAANVRPPIAIDEGSGVSCASDIDCRPHERCRQTCDESGFPCDGDDDCATPGSNDFCRPRRCEILCGELTRCLTSASGELFDCDLLAAEPDDGLHETGLAFVRSGIDARRLGDNVSTGVLRFE